MVGFHDRQSGKNPVLVPKMVVCNFSNPVPIMQVKSIPLVTYPPPLLQHSRPPVKILTLILKTGLQVGAEPTTGPENGSMQPQHSSSMVTHYPTPQVPVHTLAATTFNTYKKILNPTSTDRTESIHKSSSCWVQIWTHVVRL